MPVKVAVRLQINMVFTDLSSMAKVERFSNMILPMLWFEIVSMVIASQYGAMIFFLHPCYKLEKIIQSSRDKINAPVHT